MGTTELFSGQCSHAININRVLQAALAVLAICISVSLDFFMRLASSPTVDDLREAHCQGRSWDIAIHSFRNVRQISRWRAFAWITLISSAVPVQLFSHSIAFIAFSTTSYSHLLVSEAFTTGQPFGFPGVALWHRWMIESVHSQFHEILPMFESAPNKWNKLELSDCVRIYSQDLDGLQSHRNLLVVLETGPDADADATGWIANQVWDATDNGRVNMSGHMVEYDPELENSLWSFATYCEVTRAGYYKNGGYTRCRLTYNDSYQGWDFDSVPWGEGTVKDTSSIFWLSNSHNDSDIRVAFQNPRAKYCLSEPYSAPCKVYVSNFFLLVTAVCVLLGCICSIWVARFCWYKETCQSLGDALQAFLRDRETFVQISSPLPAGHDSEVTPPRSTWWTPVSKWKEATPRWGQAINKTMWLWTYLPIGILLLGASIALGVFGENISQVPSPLLYEQPKWGLTDFKIRLHPWREPSQ